MILLPLFNVQFAFGFGNLAMLGWLAAAAAPLIIHLWSRHRFREAPWAAMQFLLAAMRKNARRLQLQQWLLLAVRTLIIALVVIAAAEPYGERLLAGIGGRPKHTILVIDDSYSMGYLVGDDSRFEKAKHLAANIVRDSGPADSFTVIRMANPAGVVFGREVVDHRDVIERIESMVLSHTGADLNQALSVVDDTADRKSPRDEAREVRFLSDFQHRTWPFSADNSNPNREIAKQQIEALAKVANISAVNLGSSNAANLAVTNVNSSEPVVVLARDATFDVILHQFGSEPRPDCAVELLVDSVPVAEKTVDIPANADTTVQFNFPFQTAGEHTVEVRAAGDKLAVDNSRWAVVPVRDFIRVLCVAGRPGSATYVVRALNPSGDGSAAIQPVVVSESDLADIELSKFDCIMLCNVEQLSASEAARIAEFTSTGGGLVVFLGDQVDAENYNSLAAGDKPLLPAEIGDTVGQSQFGLDPLDYRHPIVAPFRGRERAGLLTTPVNRYFKLNVPKERSTTQIAAATQNGDAFMVTSQFGRGRTVLVATDASLSSVDTATGEPWSNWATWPSFLPIVRELLNYAMAGRQQHWQQLVGTPLQSRGDTQGAAMPLGALNSSGLRIERPDKRVDAVSLEQTPIGPFWSYSDTDVNGFYAVKGLPNGATQTFAVNVDTSEGDLAQVDPELLPQEMQLVDAPTDRRDAGDSINFTRAGWNVNLLWAAFALLLLESFLACRFGRGTL